LIQRQKLFPPQFSDRPAIKSGAAGASKSWATSVFDPRTPPAPRTPDRFTATF
jgi:hypothetical protein